MTNEERDTYARAFASVGGLARAKTLTAAERSDIARKGARAKWRKYRAAKRAKKRVA